MAEQALPAGEKLTTVVRLLWRVFFYSCFVDLSVLTCFSFDIFFFYKMYFWTLKKIQAFSNPFKKDHEGTSLKFSPYFVYLNYFCSTEKFPTPQKAEILPVLNLTPYELFMSQQQQKHSFCSSRHCADLLRVQTWSESVCVCVSVWCRQTKLAICRSQYSVFVCVQQQQQLIHRKDLASILDGGKSGHRCGQNEMKSIFDFYLAICARMRDVINFIGVENIEFKCLNYFAEKTNCNYFIIIDLG